MLRSRMRRNNKEPKKSSDDEVEGGGCFINLPSELIVEILSRLPAESVLRYKSVCKSWHSLISEHPCLVYLNHRLVFASKLGCIKICHLSDVLYDKSVVDKVLLINKKTELVSSNRGTSTNRAYTAASCNGLVCFLDTTNPRSLFIWNPSTRICHSPKSPGFDITFYGFGYDKSSDDYKFYARPRGFSKPKIYSLKTGKWKEIGDPPLSCYVHHNDGKYSNGALHWVFTPRADWHSKSYKDSSLWRILSLDLATETYGQASHPEYGHAGGYVGLFLGALWDERLCTLCYYYNEKRSDIWVMRDKDSWTKLVSIPPWPVGRGFIMPLFISNDGKVLFEHWRRLILYDSKTGSFSEIQTGLEVDGNICIFVESSKVSPHPQALIIRASIQIKESIRAICKDYFGIKVWL